PGLRDRAHRVRTWRRGSRDGGVGAIQLRRPTGELRDALGLACLQRPSREGSGSLGNSGHSRRALTFTSGWARSARDQRDARWSLPPLGFTRWHHVLLEHPTLSTRLFAGSNAKL